WEVYHSPSVISNPEKFFNQDFKNLKQYCLTKGVRYLDDMFPPDAKSVGQGILMPSDLAHVKWLRPQIAPDAEFVVDGVSRFDFGQGVLGRVISSLLIFTLLYLPTVLIVLFLLLLNRKLLVSCINRRTDFPESHF
uniref:Calpain catalytic domain-containing protein n=1 Tax=Maylandia zebra TaxID=106582 RepID=A0A3P9BGF6_9CICH